MYIPKRLLITGGAGFIGSNFVNYLLEKRNTDENYKDLFIVNVDCINYCSTNDMGNQKDNYKFSYTDIKDYENIKIILNTYKIDTIIHFAAQSHVDNSFGNSIPFTLDNILGTHTLLECCREYGKIKRFIHISTDEVYGEVDMDNNGCIEKGVLNPTNPYAATKAGAEFLVRSYYHSFKLPVIITRGNNVYGPRQYPEKLIPAFTTNLLKGEKCKIHGKGLSRRNFIHVNDVCTAVETIMNKGHLNEIYNIGTDNEFNVLEILQKLVYIIKKDTDYLQYSEFVEDRVFNDFRYCIDSSKLRELGWSESVLFSKGLKETIDWYASINNQKIFH
jgi:UDP-glucose 4,6-dehydratase